MLHNITLKFLKPIWSIFGPLANHIDSVRSHYCWLALEIVMIKSWVSSAELIIMALMINSANHIASYCLKMWSAKINVEFKFLMKNPLIWYQEALYLICDIFILIPSFKINLENPQCKSKTNTFCRENLMKGSSYLL